MKNLCKTKCWIHDGLNLSMISSPSQRLPITSAPLLCIINFKSPRSSGIACRKIIKSCGDPFPNGKPRPHKQTGLISSTRQKSAHFDLQFLTALDRHEVILLLSLSYRCWQLDLEAPKMLQNPPNYSMICKA